MKVSKLWVVEYAGHEMFGSLVHPDEESAKAAMAMAIANAKYPGTGFAICTLQDHISNQRRESYDDGYDAATR